MKTDYVFSDNRRSAAVKAAYATMSDSGEIDPRRLQTAPRDKRRANCVKDRRKSIYWQD